MIRAFPAMAVFFLPVPALWWLWETRKREGKLPGIRRIVERERPLLVTIGAAAITVAVLVGASGARFGFAHSWVDWAHKISLHSVKPNVNHVGLRTLVQYSPSKSLRGLSRGGGDWSVEQVNTFRERKPLYFFCIAAITLLAISAARRSDLRQAALLGMMLIPVFFYPSNYYLHYVFVLPMLVDYSDDVRKRWMWALVSIVLLAISVSEYWGFDVRGVDERYVHWSVGVLAGFLAIFYLLERDVRQKLDEETAAEGPAGPAGPPEPAAG
jgi:hypothetical protein